MVVVYLIYGFSFLAGGLLLAFQSRLPSGVVSRGVLWWLAAFALTHGLSEWVRLLTMLGPGATSSTLELIGIGLGALSFLFLVEFGVEFYAHRGHRLGWWRALPGLLFLSFILFVAIHARNGLADASLRSFEAASRYAFGLPGSLLTAAALLRLDHERHAENQHIGVRYFAAASATFVAYAVLAGALPSSAPFLPASHLNAEAFYAFTHVRLELLRAACAVALTISLSEAFVIRAARERVVWERRREEFIGVIVHDFRNPLGAILLGATSLESMLAGNGEVDRERTRRILRTIRKSARRLELMVRDLLDSSRIEAEALALKTRDVELRSLLEGIIDRASHMLQGHTVRTVLPEALTAVCVDPGRIEQILGNLLSNAVKYGAPEMEITVEAIVHADEVEIAVTNRGEGLSPDEASHVFARFYRSEARADQVEGLGLGLYIARGLVVAHGGRMWLDTKRGEYASFRFTVPRSAETTRHLALDRQPSIP